MTCPACNGKRHDTTQITGVYVCLRCKAIHGQCYLGESYELVLPYMTAEDVPHERLRYYDIQCLGSEGITRRHGWYDVESKVIVQTG